MTKKRRSNGFMYFAEAMRVIYEAENGSNCSNQMSTKRLMERANKDWKQMSDEQRERWIAESRRRKEEYQKQAYKLQSISVTTKKKQRPVSNLEKSLLPKPIVFCLSETQRKALRQSVYQKLIWRENEDLKQTLGKKKFGLLTVRAYRSFDETQTDDDIGCPPAEMCLNVISLEDNNRESHRVLIRHDYSEGHRFFRVISPADHGFSSLCQTANHLDVNRACLRIANQLRACWSNLILVPASQYQDVAASLVWIKNKRDNAFKRDTASIRVERLICLEDMLAVIGSLLEVTVDDTPLWEQNISALSQFACKLHTNAPDKCPCVVGKAACEHFLKVLKEATRQLNKPTQDNMQPSTSTALMAGDISSEMAIKETTYNNHTTASALASHTNHMRNPFQLPYFTTANLFTNNSYTRNLNTSFGSLRTQIPDPIQTVAHWLNTVDFGSNDAENDDNNRNIETFEFHNTCSAFVNNLPNELFDTPHRS